MHAQQNDADASGKEEDILNYHLKGGKILADISPGEEIVVSGLSGFFPNSMNVHEFRENLFNKVNMASPNRRWDYDHPEMPTCSGTIPEIDKYDSGFFGIHERQSHSLDTMARLLQERTVEAIFDAGLHPSDLEGSNTGVFVGASFSENNKEWCCDNLNTQTYAITGSERSMIAHRISYFLKLKGPSYTTDTACSSSLYALEHAFKAIRLGEIDTAIVAGVNLCLHPSLTMQFSRLGVLSHDGACKSFDIQGNGYARSETIAAIILQKSKFAKREYAQVVYVKTNSDGYKEQGISFPSGPAQIDLMTEFYDECDADRFSLSYLEAHGTGTLVGDPEECFAIDKVFTEGRSTPLLIGSVKSNIGHSEPAAGLCSLIKCIIAMETGYIPPNIHFTTPRKEIKGIVEGRLKVVVDKKPFEDDNGLIGINSFGFGGSNCHMLIKRNVKEKVNKGLPRDDLPRLVCVSGRTAEAVKTLLDAASCTQLDVEFIGLLHEGFRKNVENHLYRGYAILTKTGEIDRSLKLCPARKPLCIAFGEFHNWCDVGNKLMALPAFSAFIQKSQKELQNKGIDIHDILINNKIPKWYNIQLLGSTVVIAGVIDTLNTICIKPKIHLGYFFGELISSYCNGFLTLEETINCAFMINETINNDNNNNNKYIKETLQNSSVKSNNSGSALDTLKAYLDTSILKESLIQNLSKVLKEKKRWARHFVNSLSQTTVQGVETVDLDSLIFQIGNGSIDTSENLSVISIFDNEKGNYLVEFMKFLGRLYEVGYNPQISKLYPLIQFPVSRGTKMISPFIKWLHRRQRFVAHYSLDLKRQAKLGGKLYQIHSADHRWTYITKHVINVTSQLTNAKSNNNIPTRRVYWVRNLNTCGVYELMARKDCKKYEGKFLAYLAYKTKFRPKKAKVLNKEEFTKFLNQAPGRNLFPATGYLYIVWNTFAIVHGMSVNDMQIMFENCKFLRATTVPKKSGLFLEVAINFGTGNFEITEGDELVAKGRVSMLDGKRDHYTMPTIKKDALRTWNSSDLPLKSKDVYKELLLRGYNYQGAFQGIQEISVDASKAMIIWEDNWVTFLDNMMQLMILQLDSRLLYVPIYISKLTISAKEHINAIEHDFASNDKTRVVPVYYDKVTGVISSGKTTMSSILAKSIPRRKDLAVPILEKYEFVANNTELDLHESVRVNIQIILENALTYQVKAVELIDQFTPKDVQPLIPMVEMILKDQPLVHSFVKILSETPLDVDVEVENKKLNKETDCLLIIASNVLKRQNILNEAFMALKENGFIISRENLDYENSPLLSSEITVLTVHRTPTETLLLLQKKVNVKESSYIKVTSSDDFSWILKLQQTLKNKCDVVLYAEKEPTSGILGLVNCLRREPDSRHVRCVFLMDEVTEFQPRNSICANQLKKNMTVNVYKNKQWGTYRHLLVKKQYSVEKEHCFVNQTIVGDLSRLKWFEGSFCHQMLVPPENKLVYVYYCALNFRDVMLASGKLNIDAITQDRLKQECVLGFEFSGRDSRGRRIMGMTTFGSLSTLVLTDVCLSMEVPDSWSLEEAVTVPVAYGTLVYALPIRGQLKRGESILINSGTGAVGQAAIRLSLYYGCKVFITVGTQEKREFLKKTFPVLEDRQIGNSRDVSFEQMIYRETNGRGVDVVLNSLAEDKLIASIRCLAKGGRLVEIGKYDMANNNELNMLLFQKEASFHGVMLDQLFEEGPSVKAHIMNMLSELLKNGAVQPINRTVFNYNDIEKAFRFMTTGKHIGKVLIKIREPEKESMALPSIQQYTCVPRFICSPEKTYVIIGGLGGFGLELADWLVVRGARKLVFSSRKGISNGYQHMRIRLWKSYGTVIKISTASIATKNGCHQLIHESLELGPIDAVFNLAVVLEDSIFENQSPKTFMASFAPKATATIYLDEITREICPDLSQFVVFSSVSCGRGNAGQTNYGMANSVMERICERRRQNGYPALAIEWGAVGEVGLVAEMLGNADTEISGTLQQKISSCLEVLDTLLRQKDAAIVSSMVLAEKRGTNAVDNIADAVLNILGITDVKSISLHSTLPELGMDSMSGVEIKQTLEREFDVYLTPKDLRAMTLTRLKEIQEEKHEISQNGEVADTTSKLEIIFKLIGDESKSMVPYLVLKSKKETEAPKVLLFPGIEGFANTFDNMVPKINAHVIGLQLTYGNQALSIVEMAESMLPIVEAHLSKTEPFNIVAFSYGSLVALEIIHILESKGYKGTIIFLDGAPTIIQKLLEQFDVTSDEYFQTTFICYVLSTYVSTALALENKEAIFKCSSWDERVNLGTDLVKDSLPYGIDYFKAISNNLYWRLKALIGYSPSFTNLMSNVKLYKPKQITIQNLEEDYGLSKIFTKPIEIKVFEGNHFTFLEDVALAEALNEDIHKWKTTCS